jgi:transcriptional regulator with XRE-family HTH domain
VTAAELRRVLLESARRLPDELVFTPLAGATAVLLRIPVEKLVVEIPRARSVLLASWPAGTEPDAGSIEAGRTVLAAAVVARTRTGSRITVTRPPCHAWLAFARTEEGAPPRKPPRTLGETVLHARTAAGLSARELAASAGTAPTSVIELERGRDARASTLTALLGVLPGLSAWEMLGPERRTCSRREAWLWHRDLLGCEAEEERKVVRIGATGDARLHLETRRVRALRQRGDLVIRIGRTAGGLRSAASLRSVDARGETGNELRIVRSVEDEASHLLVVPASRLARGASWVREMAQANLYALTAERARARGIEGDEFEEGASFAATVAARVLRLRVELPAGYEPRSLRGFCWPAWQAPDPRGRDVAPLLHPEGLELRRRGRACEVVVEWPLPHVKYGIGWGLP